MHVRIELLGERADARALLVAATLPIDDIEDPAISLFGAYDGDALVGVVGLQRCGEHALLRSLAVASAQQKRGIARVLCEHVFEQARAMSSLWLLTTSAQHYFARLGFAVIPRSDVPEAIRATTQFSSLCPASAVVMKR